MQWAQDPELLATRVRGPAGEAGGARRAASKTVKLRNVVPPIRFESGVADIPPSYIERLRGVLDGMQHLENVRLHLVGHADDQPLSDALAGIYGDNAGLSRERAGEVAEFIQTALALPPEAISFEWAGDTQPIATNATRRGQSAEPARRGRGLVRRDREQGRDRGGRRPRGDQAASRSAGPRRSASCATAKATRGARA